MRSILKGKATREATLEFLSKKFTPIPTNGWKLEGLKSAEEVVKQQNKHELPFYFSKLCFGGHTLSLNHPEGDTATEDQQFSLQKAIQGGVNMIDTSADYGTSQKLIGTVLSGMISDPENNLHREEFVLMSKVGPLDNYVDQRNHSVLSRLAHECQVPDLDKRVITLPDNIHHYSLDPVIISHEITRCLKEYQVETLDVMVLNQPERLLQAMLMKSNDFVATFEEFYEMISKAFECLEQEVENGRIQSYGIASKAITRLPTNQPGVITLDLKRCLKIAEGITKSTSHHFKVVQVPFNLHEKDVFTRDIFFDEKQQKQINFLTFAKNNGLSTMGYRPLNSQLDSHLIFRFAEYKFEKTKNDMEKLVEEYQTTANEIAYNELNTPWYSINLSDDTPVFTKDVESCTLPELSARNLMKMRPSISWGHIIMTNYDQLESYFTFQKVLHNRILPEQKHIFSQLSQISAKVNENDYNAVGMKTETTGKDANQLGNFKKQCNQWLSHYQRLCNKFFNLYSDLMSVKHQHQCEDLNTKLSQISEGDLDQYHTLAQKSIRCLVDTPKLDTVIVGMDKTKYVDEFLFNSTNSEYSLLQTRSPEKQAISERVIRDVTVKNFRFIVEEDNKPLLP